MFLSIKEIAQMTCYRESTVRKMVALPDFPRPIRWTEGADPRWCADEVKEWLMARKEAA